MYRVFGKRLIDILIASAALIVLLPLFFILILIISFTARRSPVFRQLRPGKHEKIFPFLKFKTMSDAIDDQGKLLPDEKRLTFLGRWIRSTSLDELPQLWNVLKGDMSLVGPRPLLIEYLPLYSDKQRRRHQIRPGITGWAQVNGRNLLTWEQKFEFDLWYVDHYSFGLDLRILMLTLLKVIKREGIYAGGTATMEKFKGNSPSTETK